MGAGTETNIVLPMHFSVFSWVNFIVRRGYGGM